jgi:4-hydroxy-tetrahydrodipicolinate reductase
MRELVARTGIGVLVAANFSVGMNIFQLVVEHAARLLASQETYGAWIHELHHATKKDAPSGTALELKAGMERSGYHRTIDVASTRAGSMPGIHVVGFDGPSDSLTFTHEVRDRAVFARGALEAAKWLEGRRGWFTMREMLTMR